MILKKIFLFGVLSIQLIDAQVVEGSFNTGNTVIYKEFGTPSKISLLSNGKFLISGRINNMGVIYQLNNDGSLDSNFGSGGKVIIDEPNFAYDDVNLIDVQQDGKIIYAHSGFNFSSSPQTRLERLNADGSIDNNFYNSWFGVGASTNFFSITLLPNGKIMAFFSQSSSQGIILYNNNGTIDTSFGNNGTFSVDNFSYFFLNAVSSNNVLLTNTQGKVINFFTNGIIGTSTSINLSVIETNFHQNYLYLFEKGRISKISPNVSLDQSFGVGGHVNFPLLSTDIYGNSINLLNGDISQLNIKGAQQTFEIYNFNNLGQSRGSYASTINMLGNLQDGKLAKNNFDNNYYVLLAGSETNKVALIKISQSFLTVKENHKSDKFVLYPNPVKDIIKFNSDLKNIAVLDGAGKKVLVFDKPVRSLNVASLPTGLYWLTGSTRDNVIINEKFVKE
jgi:uncharacterized delta-60 repeat protein